MRLIVDISIHPRGTVNLYINNSIGLTVDIKGTDTTRLERAPLLGVSAVA
jgi:hypothetical protein